MLATHLAYDTSNLQTATMPVAILQQRLSCCCRSSAVPPSASACCARSVAITPRLRALLDRMQRMDRIRARRGLVGSRRGACRHRCTGARRSMPPPTGRPSCWSACLVRLHELTDLVHDIMALQRQIRAEPAETGDADLRPQARPSVRCSIVITSWPCIRRWRPSSPSGWFRRSGSRPPGPKAPAPRAWRPSPAPSLPPRTIRRPISIGFLVAAVIALVDRCDLPVCRPAAGA